jgi:hypothetical protein
MGCKDLDANIQLKSMVRCGLETMPLHRQIAGPVSNDFYSSNTLAMTE